jgi:ABC-type maltose transport system permease subunit
VGIWDRVLVTVAYAFARLRLCFESSVIMITNAWKKLMARTAPLFVQFYKKGTIDIYRTTIVSNAFFALLLTVVILSFATDYTVDYAAQTAAMVVTIPLVVLVLIFQRGVVYGLTTGTVER